MSMKGAKIIPSDLITEEGHHLGHEGFEKILK